MKNNTYPGKFIVFEGLDGSGSSTQADMLAKFLSFRHKVLLTKEPTNNLIGGLIRSQLTGDWKSEAECLQLLFAADRAHHLQREIIPALKEGRMVISDRYFMSTVSFGSLELDKDWLLKINDLFLVPDLVILLKVRPEECVKRMKQTRFRLELFEEEKKLKKVWQTYDWLAKRFPNVKVIDGEQDKNWVFQSIVRELSEFIDLNNQNTEIVVVDKKEKDKS